VRSPKSPSRSPIGRLRSRQDFPRDQHFVCADPSGRARHTHAATRVPVVGCGQPLEELLVPDAEPDGYAAGSCDLLLPMSPWRPRWETQPPRDLRRRQGELPLAPPRGDRLVPGGVIAPLRCSSCSGAACSRRRGQPDWLGRPSTGGDRRRRGGAATETMACPLLLPTASREQVTWRLAHNCERCCRCRSPSARAASRARSRRRSRMSTRRSRRRPDRTTAIRRSDREGRAAVFGVAPRIPTAGPPAARLIRPHGVGPVKARLSGSDRTAPWRRPDVRRIAALRHAPTNPPIVSRDSARSKA